MTYQSWVKEKSIGYSNTSLMEIQGIMKKPVERIVEKKIEEPQIPIEIPLRPHKDESKINRKPWSIIAPEHRSTGKHSGLRIQGRNLDTGEIRVWESIRDAAEEVTGDRRKNSNILVSGSEMWKLLWI